MNAERATWTVCAVVWLFAAFSAGLAFTEYRTSLWLDTVWCVPMTEINPPPEPDISPLRLDA